jgi:MFS family permease
VTDAVRPDRPRRNLIVRATAGSGRAAAAGWHRLSAWNEGRGAAASGLARLVEAHALQAAGDATITVALAGSLFFSVPTAQARTRVALYLLVTMAPFAVVAPVLGPLLDRFRHGRRFALAATMIVRATLGLVIGHSLASHSGTSALALYPAALGVLVCMKTYAIARSAAVPRVLPPEMTLVQANSRLTLAGVVVPGIAGAVAVGVGEAFGRMNALRLGAVVYGVAAVLALRLPRKVDGGRETRAAEQQPARAGLARLGQVDADVAAALRSAAALRWLAGFLLLFGAFVVKAHPVLHGPNVSLAGLAIGIGVGNALGVVVGARAPVRAIARLDALLLAVTAVVTLLTAVRFSLLTVFAVAVVSSATAAVVKLGLDATIQERVDDAVRTSTFARSETTLQLAWVVGGGVGIALPSSPTAGFLVATAVLGAALVIALRSVRRPQSQPA